MGPMAKRERRQSQLKPREGKGPRVFQEARTEEGVGRGSNERPIEHKKSQPKIWRPEYQTRLKRGP